MPCCPSHAAVAIVLVIEPPPCCDLSNQPARPLASALMPGKFRSGQLIPNGAAGAMFVPPQAGSALSLIGASPPFVKPVFDLKTDLRV